MSSPPEEVITIGLPSIQGDPTPLQTALRYGATHQVKVRLIVGTHCAAAALDDFIHAQLGQVGRALGALPPVVEVHWPQPGAARVEQ